MIQGLRLISTGIIRVSAIWAVVCLAVLCLHQTLLAKPSQQASSNLAGQAVSKPPAVEQGDEWVFDGHGSVEKIGGEWPGKTSLSFTETELVMDKYLDDTRRVAFVRSLTHPLRGPGVDFVSIWPFRLDIDAGMLHLPYGNAGTHAFDGFLPSSAGLTSHFDMSATKERTYVVDAGNYLVGVNLVRVGRQKINGIECVRFDIKPTETLPCVLTKQSYADGPAAPKTTLKKLSGSIWVSLDGRLILKNEHSMEFTQQTNPGPLLSELVQPRQTLRESALSTVTASISVEIRSNRHLTGNAYALRARQLEEIVRIRNLVEHRWLQSYDLTLDADTAERRIVAFRKEFPNSEFEPVLKEFTWMAAKLRKEPEINPKYVNVPSKLLGKPAPDIVGTADDGAPFTLASLKGKPVILFFFGDGYTDVDTDAPQDLSTFAARWQNQGFALIGLVSTGRDAGAAAKVKERLHIGFPVVWPKESATPWERTSYLYDAGRFAIAVVSKEGIVKYKGSDLYPSEIEPVLQNLIDK